VLLTCARCWIWLRRWRWCPGFARNTLTASGATTTATSDKHHYHPLLTYLLTHDRYIMDYRLQDRDAMALTLPEQWESGSVDTRAEGTCKRGWGAPAARFLAVLGSFLPASSSKNLPGQSLKVKVGGVAVIRLFRDQITGLSFIVLEFLERQTLFGVSLREHDFRCLASALLDWAQKLISSSMSRHLSTRDISSKSMQVASEFLRLHHHHNRHIWRGLNNVNYCKVYTGNAREKEKRW